MVCRQGSDGYGRGFGRGMGGRMAGGRGFGNLVDLFSACWILSHFSAILICIL